MCKYNRKNSAEHGCGGGTFLGGSALRGSISAPVPALAPGKQFRRLRLHLRLREKGTGPGGSGSDVSYKNLEPAIGTMLFIF